METSVNYTIYSEKNYDILEKLYMVFFDNNYFHPELSYQKDTYSIEVSYDSAGGIYKPIEHVQLFDYIFKKYGIKDVEFLIHGCEDSDYGNYILFDIKYENQKILLRQAYYNIDGDVENEPCDEMTFAVAGKLKYFENQEELTDYIYDLGGEYASGVSKNTAYLITNNKSGTTVKHKKATELDIPMITELEFIKRFGDIYDFDIEEDSEDYEEQAKRELEATEFVPYKPSLISWEIRDIDIELVEKSTEKLNDILK